MIVLHPTQMARWPLRWLGLDPGRSLTNAAPSASQIRHERMQQFAYIAERLAADDEQLAILAGHVEGRGRDELSIVVFDHGRVIACHAPLDRPLRDVIGNRADAD